MLSLLYTLAYLSSLTALFLWFFYQKNPQRSRLMSGLFLGGYGLYVLSLAFADGGLSYKLLVLFRDMAIMGASVVVLNLLKQNKALLFVGLAIAITLHAGFVVPKMLLTFPEARMESPNLDPQAELLVEVSEGHQIEELARLISDYGLTYSPAFELQDPAATDLDDFYAVNVPEKELHRLPKIKERLEQSSLIDWVEENERVQVAPIEGKLPAPIKRKYGVDDPGLEQQWGFEAMQVDQLYKLFVAEKLKPQKKARIVILDTGVDASHEDLQGNYYSLNKKYDRDLRQHGTHCAGIAAGVTNNGKGIASLSPGNEFVEVSSVTVLNGPGGSGSQKTILQGILTAADGGADVLSLSLGGPSSRARQRAYAQAISYANRKGAIVVCAAGNNAGDARQIAPANAPGVITVSALDEQLQRAAFSNSVAELKMGIAAPGVNIYSTVPGNDYKTMSGTSMATPQVAGLIGLMKSLQPQLNTEEAYDILHRTGAPTSGGKQTGHLVVPHRAVKALLGD